MVKNINLMRNRLIGWITKLTMKKVSKSDISEEKHVNK